MAIDKNNIKQLTEIQEFLNHLDDPEKGHIFPMPHWEIEEYVTFYLHWAVNYIIEIEAKHDQLIIKAYWEWGEPSFNGVNYCSWCGFPKKLQRHLTPETFPHKENCPVKKVVEKRKEKNNLG